jgi:hypothetical protein
LPVELKSIAAPRLLELGVPLGTSDIFNTSYSARGSTLTTMVLGQGEGEARLTAGVISSGWLSWGTALSMARPTLKWILVLDAALLELVCAEFPRVKVMLWGQTEVNNLPAVDIVAFNGLFESNNRPYHFGTVYLWDWDPQVRWPGLVFKDDTIKHVECGGVSDFEGKIVIGTVTAGPRFPIRFHVESPAGDLGSILQS